MNFNELRELVAALNQTDIAELTLKNAEFELTLRKPSALQPDVVVGAPAPPAMPVFIHVHSNERTPGWVLC